LIRRAAFRVSRAGVSLQQPVLRGFHLWIYQGQAIAVENGRLEEVYDKR
jgi:hypothetical protein